MIVKENKLNAPIFFLKRELFEKNKIALYGASRKLFEKGQGWGADTGYSCAGSKEDCGKIL